MMVSIVGDRRGRVAVLGAMRFTTRGGTGSGCYAGVSVVAIFARVLGFFVGCLALDFLRLGEDTSPVCGGGDKNVVCTGKRLSRPSMNTLPRRVDRGGIQSRRFRRRGSSDDCRGENLGNVAALIRRVNGVCGGRGGGVVRVGFGVRLACFEVVVDVALFAVGVTSGTVGVFVEEDEADEVADQAGTTNGEDEDGPGDCYELVLWKVGFGGTLGFEESLDCFEENAQTEGKEEDPVDQRTEDFCSLPAVRVFRRCRLSSSKFDGIESDDKRHHIVQLPS